MRIHCEGPMKRSTIILASDVKQAAADYKLRYCYGSWRLCRIARMLWAQYDDTDSLGMMRRVKPFQVRGEKI